MRYRVIAKFDNETRIYEDNKMYSLLGHTEAEWIKIFEEVLGFNEHQAKSALSRAHGSQCYDGLVYIRTAWERMQERKSKMTREEALNKIKNSTNIIDSPGGLANALEALGLIKFKEKPPMVVRFDTKAYPNGLVIMLDGKVISP